MDQQPAQRRPIPPSAPSRKRCMNDYEKRITPGVKRRVRCGLPMRRVVTDGGLWYRCDHCDPLT